MTDLAARLALKERLPRTWPAFFERHGNFTAIQLATIPPLLEGHNVIVCAPTASGKTEAAMAPLVELHCRHAASGRCWTGAQPRPSSARRAHDSTGLSILYLTPTRALVNDLSARLAHPLQLLRLSIGMRTRDLSTFDPAHPPNVLLTTPESADSLLAGHARIFANLRAIVLDELHLLDRTPRGDQVRVILSRLRRIRDYARTCGRRTLDRRRADPSFRGWRRCIDRAPKRRSRACASTCPLSRRRHRRGRRRRWCAISKTPTGSSSPCWTWGRSIACCPRSCATAPPSSSLTSRVS